MSDETPVHYKNLTLDSFERLMHVRSNPKLIPHEDGAIELIVDNLRLYLSRMQLDQHPHWRQKFDNILYRLLIKRD